MDNSSNSASGDSTTTPPPPPPPIPAGKKKRSLPGMPDPDAEVISLSPKSLLATNRFVCEVCKKGFQRDQNLQLHRRGHNLPWKLRQRNGQEVRKRVYVCPEPSCVHHDPSRALGDLTGIKKHYCRKHGEKKWRCDKCGKKYAVMSDWKAHFKTCGTKEYRCDCGTLFSRRDSFITHRAFCDALAEESKAAVVAVGSPEKTPMLGRLPMDQSEEPEAAIGMQEYSPPPALAAINSNSGNNAASTSTSGNNNNNNNNTSMFASLFSSTSPSVATAQTASFTEFLSSINHQPEPTSMHLSQFIAPPTPTPTPTPQLSATALLQKAAQMGVATSSSSFLRGLGLATSMSPPPPPPPSNHYWETDPTAIGLGLGLPKRATLDLLGLGIGPGSAGRGLSTFMTSIGSGGLDIGPGLSWDGADRKPGSSAIL